MGIFKRGFVTFSAVVGTTFFFLVCNFPFVGQLRADAATFLYLDDELGNLAKVDVENGTVGLIGNTGFALTDIAFDPSANLYGLTFDKLWRVDPTTADATLVGSHGILGANSLVFGNDGTLYAGGSNTRGLYTINPNTASSSLIGDTGFNMSGDLAFHNEKLYGASYNPNSSDSLATDYLLEINASTGAGTLIGSIGPTSVFGLASADNGILYGVAGTDILSIDTATGLGTSVFNYNGSGLGNVWGATSKISSPSPPDDGGGDTDPPPQEHPTGSVEPREGEPIVSKNNRPTEIEPPPLHGLWSMQEQGGKTVLLPGTAGFDASKPTVVLVHGWEPNNVKEDGTDALINSSLPSWIRDTVENPITGTLNYRKDINVLAWNWMDISSTTYGFPDPPFAPQGQDPITKKPWPGNLVWKEGRLMARALETTFAESGTVLGKINGQPPIHLIGHSNGGGVVSFGGYLLDGYGYDVDQITLFDAPDGEQPYSLTELKLDGWIEKNALGRGIWIDNYPTSFGKNYFLDVDVESGGDIVNIDTKGLFSISPLNHGYPFNWYFGVDDKMFNAIEKGTLSKSNGMPISDVGAAWSKVLNPAPRIQGQSIDTVRRELGQNDPFLVKENSLQDPSVYTLLPWDASTRPTSGHTAKVDIGAVVDYWLKKGDVYFLDGYYHMATASPVFLFREYSFPTDSQSLSFDFLLENPLPEDELWFFVGLDPLFGFDGGSFPENWDGFLSSPPINVSEYAGTNQWLTFLYNSEETGHRAQIGNINLYRFEENTDSSVVPEPSTAILFILGMLGFCVVGLKIRLT